MARPFATSGLQSPISRVILFLGGVDVYRFKPLILSFCVVVFASTALCAQNKDGVLTINGGTRVLFLKPPTRIANSDDNLPAGLKVIYSNLGHGDQAYSSFAGVGIVGKDAGQPLPQWVGIAFTPKTDSVVQVVRVGAGYVSGTNQVAILLDEDDHNTPGHKLHAWAVSNLPEFGTCCVLQTKGDADGIAVKGGTQYWVVLRTLPQGSDTYGVWNDNYQELEGTWANNTGQGWHTSYQALPAVGVYGK